MAVLTFSHNADGPQQGGDAGGEHFREEGGHNHCYRRDHQGDGAQILLQAVQQLPLGPVHLQDVDGADDHAPVDDGHGGGRGKHPVHIPGVKHVVPPQGGHHLLIQGVAVLRVSAGAVRLLLAGLSGTVVEDQPRRVGDQDAGGAHAVQHVHHPGHLLGGQGLQFHESGGHHRRLAFQRIPLGGEQQLLRGHEGVGVQQHQHHREDDKVAQGVFHLEGGKKGDLIFLVHSFAR